MVDGWNAYLRVICEQQSCMAHLLRKIRRFRDAFPSLSSIVKFYVKLRRILRDGERLQADRGKLGEKVFQRRSKRLEKRLDDLLNWANPNAVLLTIYVTCKLRWSSFPKYLKESLRHYTRTGKPMLLDTCSTFFAVWSAGHVA